MTNKYNLKIECSLFIPMKKNETNLDIDKMQEAKLNSPCVIYCHSQSGNKIEGMFLQEFCIQNGYGLLVFDFNACGQSEGEYVSLGLREQDDLD